MTKKRCSFKKIIESTFLQQNFDSSFLSCKSIISQKLEKKIGFKLIKEIFYRKIIR